MLQLVQYAEDELPVKGLAVPAGQGVQAEEALSPGEAPKVPAGHALQTLAPALL